jgi:uncharacterized protein YjgD (DUF1641 family)
MAIAVEFREFTPRNSRNDLMRRLEQAPEEHAEAILSAYDLLQRMHERGLIDIASGLLSAGNTVIERVADVASSKQVITALRLVLMVTNLLDKIDPDQIAAILSAPERKPHSLLAIGKDAMSEDARVGLATAVRVLKVLGSSLREEKLA